MEMGMQENELQALVLAIAAIVVVLFVSVIVLMVKLRSLRKRYNKMMNGFPAGNMEELLIALQDQVNEEKAKTKDNGEQIAQLTERMKKMKANVGLQRYNAFSQHGSDLSFSLAVLDDNQNGVVLTGIHSREESYLYAKPIEKGQSTYSLSPEEKQVIDQVGSKRNS